MIASSNITVCGGHPVMKVYDAANIRNVALVGHSGSGKTQLTSAALFDAGAVNRFGKVDEGTTVTDFDEEEISRKHTLSASLAYAEWNKTKINFIDTPGMANFFADTREALIEMVAEADETLMEKFFDAGTLTQEELVTGLRNATGAGKIFPVLCASSLLNIGVQPLLDAVLAYMPPAAERPVRGADKSGKEIERPTTDNAPVSAFVWKTIADPFAGRITMFRVMSGTLRADATVHNKTRDVAERL